MKHKTLLIALCLFIGFAAPVNADGQFVIADVIKLVLTKVINTLDLAVQKVQNSTIGLQNVQKELENEMSKLQLDGITGWVQQQKNLYQEYYNELSQVKQLISDYDKVKNIVELQARIVSEYQTENALFRQDKHFTAAEFAYMGQVYSGIISESAKNLDQALFVVSSLLTQMTDGERLNIINSAYAGMQKNYNDLRIFNSQNIRVSLQRGVAEGDIETVKQLYGLQ